MTATSAGPTFAPKGISHQMGGGTRPPQKASNLRIKQPHTASQIMGTSQRSQSLRGPRPSYGKLQETQGRPLEGRLRRALSLRQGPEKSRFQELDGGVEGLKAPAHERLQGSLGDTEQLIEAQQGSSRRWLRQYQQQVRRRWQSFVSSLPGVTLSRPTSSEHPLDTTSCKP